MKPRSDTAKRNQHSSMEIEDKRRLAIDDFNQLIIPGTIGFFKSCEVTQIYLLNTNTQKVDNFYTLASFSEKTVSNNKKSYLTKSPISINDNTQMGIAQFQVPLDNARRLFDILLNGSFQLGDNKSCVSQNLVLLPKQYVPQLWGGTTPVINQILKPNFYGENYIVEFFDEEKDVVHGIDRAGIEKIFNKVKSCPEISIDLSSVYERIGCIIFQFPITALTCNCSLLQSSNSIKVQFNRHPELSPDISLSVTGKTSLDDVVTGFRTIICSTADREVEMELGDSNNMELIVALKNSDFLLHHEKSHFMREIRVNLELSTEHAKPRTINTSDSEEPVELRVASPMPIHVGRRRANEYRDHISRRILENEILANSGDYLALLRNGRKEALAFIRRKIRSTSMLKEIGLWDPYLNVQDIVDTLYFESTGVPFRGITSLKGLKKINQAEENETSQVRSSVSFDIIKQKQRTKLASLSNSLNVKLEFRCQHNIYGYPFHDRFLILVPEEDEVLPIVYSLGASVNGVGKRHHLIQKITNPRIILNNFNSLWEELLPEHCCILLLPDELGSLDQ